MPEEKSQFLKKLLKDGEAQETGRLAFTNERQVTAQAFDLQVEGRDGRWSEGFPWHHYSGRRWTDEGSHERLVILFTGRSVEILGYNLKPLLEHLREGRLTGLSETLTPQVELALLAGSRETVITSVKTFPDFEEVLNEIKGDDGDAV